MCFNFHYQSGSLSFSLPERSSKSLNWSPCSKNPPPEPDHVPILLKPTMDQPRRLSKRGPGPFNQSQTTLVLLHGNLDDRDLGHLRNHLQQH